MIKNGQITKFASYSQFQSVEEFNEHMALWIQHYGRQFSKAELIGLKQLTRYAVKVVGVANLKIGTALKVSHQETSTLKTKKIKNDKNRSRELIITHHHFPESQPQTSSSTSELDHTYTSDQVPKQFISLVKVYYNNCETIEEYWRMVKLAAYQYMFESDISYVLDTAIHSFKQTIRKIKKATVKKPIAYFYTIVHNKFAQQFYKPAEDLDDETGGVCNRGESMFSYIKS